MAITPIAAPFSARLTQAQGHPRQRSVRRPERAHPLVVAPQVPRHRRHHGLLEAWVGYEFVGRQVRAAAVAARQARARQQQLPGLADGAQLARDGGGDGRG
jgi:hypothetical protein